MVYFFLQQCVSLVRSLPRQENSFITNSLTSPSQVLFLSSTANRGCFGFLDGIVSSGLFLNSSAVHTPQNWRRLHGRPPNQQTSSRGLSLHRRIQTNHPTPQHKTGGLSESIGRYGGVGWWVYAAAAVAVPPAITLLRCVLLRASAPPPTFITAAAHFSGRCSSFMIC